jgi:peptide deformylase
MILPVIAYGDPILKQKSQPVTLPQPGLASLIDNMYETMYNAKGVGIAAPQVGQSIQLFVVDAHALMKPDPDDPNWEPPKEDLTGFKQVFINPVLIAETGETWGYREGCLSIPNIIETVTRRSKIVLAYSDLAGNRFTEPFEGLRARIIQHEYDHLQGILFTDHLNIVKRQLLRSRLAKISKGDIEVQYPMKFPNRKK